ncbi:CRISPR-associated protein Cas4 [Verrucomicrobiaceae bacterium R5-34]|nr:CRISPR-associated protein Cas4 [Verrucomicrobiaceae bacterium R5-34]
MQSIDNLCGLILESPLHQRPFLTPVPFTEDQLLPISALQHILYCPRQCALIHLEQAWAENRFTAEGNQMHKRAHEGPDESRPSVRITRSLAVRSLTYGITGQCDIVEFHKNGEVIPVEYKRGKPKSHSADEVQLCAQALCLEEMLDVQIPKAFLFYGRRKRRTEIKIDTALRNLTLQTAQQLHDLINSRKTPSAVYDKRRCDACSLIEICQPNALRLKRGAAAWFAQQLNAEP